MDGSTDESDWDFDLILSTANPALKKRLLDAHLERVLLSWLIQSSLTASVHSPLSLALTRSLETMQPASPPAERLASLPRAALANTLNNVLKRLQRGQSGRFAFVGQGAEDLAQLLQGVTDLATQQLLLTRLLDSLYLS